MTVGGMSDYWMGVLSAPALVLALGAAWIVYKGFTALANHFIGAGIIRVTAETPKARRAALCSVLYGTRRSWMFAPGSMAFVFAVGLDDDEMRYAANRLRPTADPLAGKPHSAVLPRVKGDS